MKLKIKESNYNHRKYNLISEDEYNYWFNIGIKSFNNGDKCIPVRNKELMKYYQEHNAKIGSIESKKTSQITNAWIDGWTFANIEQEFDPYESDGYAPDSDVCPGSPFMEAQSFIDEFDPFSDGSEPLPFY